MKRENREKIKELIGISSEFNHNSLGLDSEFAGGTFFAYLCDLTDGAILSKYNFELLEKCRSKLNTVYSFYDLIYPSHLDKLVSHMKVLFALIESKGLESQDQFKVILRMRLRDRYKWYLRISKPILHLERLCSYTTFIPFEHLHGRDDISFSWMGVHFSNDDFIRECTAQISDSVFTRRELELLELSVTGLSVKEIGVRTSTSCLTIKTHFQNMRKKSDTHNKTELHNFFRSNGKE
jgi:DNA-binding CsgD family transcriptional regulator